MKRYNNLFDSICDIENIKLADKKARLHKSKNFGVIVHDNHKEEDYQRLIESLQNGTYKTSRYSTFKLYEPKERIIFRLPYYPDRNFFLLKLKRKAIKQDSQGKQSSNIISVPAFM